MNALPGPLAALIQEALASHEAPSGGATFLACHHPTARMLALEGSVPATALDPAAFGAAHERAWHTLQAASRGVPGGCTLKPEAWMPEDDGTGVGRFQLEVPGEAPLRLLTGVRMASSGYRIAWLDLAEREETPSFALGEAAMLAGFADVEARAGLPARSFLDLSFDRLRRCARPNLALLPEQRFACQGSGACCRLRYEIDAPPAAQAMLDAMPWAALGAPDLIGTQLPVLPSGRLQVRDGSSPCRFLDPHDRCRIHLALGTPVFAACVAFPLRFTETNDGYAVTATYFCGSARHNLGPPLAERREELWRRLAVVGPTTRRPADHRLAPGVLLTAEAFDASIEAWLNDVTPDGDQLFQALHRAGESLRGAPHTALTPLPPLEAEAVVASLRFWFQCLAFLGEPLSPLAHADPVAGPPRDAVVLARWLRTTWHARELAYAFDLQLAHHLLLVLAAAVRALEEHHGDKVPEDAWALLGAVTSHGRAEAVFGSILSAAPFLREAWERPQTGRDTLRWLAAAA